MFFYTKNWSHNKKNKHTLLVWRATTVMVCFVLLVLYILLSSCFKSMSLTWKANITLGMNSMYLKYGETMLIIWNTGQLP